MIFPIILIAIDFVINGYLLGLGVGIEWVYTNKGNNMKHQIQLLIAIVLVLGFVTKSNADNSVPTMKTCQMFMEVMASKMGYRAAFYKVRGDKYVFGGNYAEFIMDLEGRLAKIKCSTKWGKIVYLKMGDNLIVNN